MKKTIALIALAMMYLHSRADYTGTVNTSTADLAYSTKSGYNVVTLPGKEYSTTVGAPQMPVKTLSFLIPIDKKVSSIVINSTTSTTLPGTYNMYPVQTPSVVEGTLPFVNPDPAVYGSSSPYPATTYAISNDGYPMGYHVVTIKFYPLKYTPSAQTLTLYTSINFTIVYAANTDNVVLPARQSTYSSEVAKKYIQSMVTNPLDISSVTGGALNVVGTGTGAANLRGMGPTAVINIPDYIIITKSSLVGTATTGFQKLANWKTQKGVSTLVTTTEDIAINYSGTDLAEKIRNYLKDVYVNFGSVYVLLGGDVKDDSGNDLMPVRRVLIGSEGIDIKETDYYFATVQGTWNANCNSMFGEATDVMDMSQKFFVGRAPAQNLADATSFATKVVNYENLKNGSTPLSDLNYVDRLSLWGNDCSSCGGNGFGSYISSELNTAAALTPSPTYTVSKLYYTTSPQLNHTNAMNDLSGVSTKYHVFYHLDHGGFDNLSTGSGWSGGGITPAHMDALTNGAYNSVFYTDACNPNDFVYNSVSKHYINNATGGGVAFWGNVSAGWSGDVGYFTDYFMNALYAGTKASGLDNYDNLNYRAGYLLYYSATTYQMRLKNRNLLGDPEMMLWTAPPQNLTVSGIAYSPSAQQITGTVSGLTFSSTPAVVVTVTAWKDGDLWASQDYTVSTSSLNFTLSNVLANTTGNILLTVTAHNYIPNISTITVPSIGGAHPYDNGRQVVDDGTLGSTGNGDNYADAGETITLPVTITNSGSSTATNVTATLDFINYPYQLSTDVSMVNNTSSFGNISAGASATPSGGTAFVFTIDPDIFDGITPHLHTEYLHFSLKIFINSALYTTRYFDLEIGEPNLVKGENTVTGGLAALSNNQLKIKLYNMGLSEAVGLTATLSTNNPGNVTVTGSTDTYNNIPPMDNTNNYATDNTMFTFDMGSAAYSNETFNLHVQNAYGRTWNFNNFKLTPPVATISAATSGQYTSIGHSWTCTITSPAGDQILGYNLYRSNTSSGPYVQLNTNLIPYTSFNDVGLNPLTLYYYALTVVDTYGNESAKYYYTGSTSLSAHNGWPVEGEAVTLPIINRSYGSPNVLDVTPGGDNKKELFFTTGFGDIGGVWAFNEDASRWYSYDGNVTNKSGYIKYDCVTMATPALDDIDNDGVVEMGVDAGYNSSSANSDKYFVYDVVNTPGTPPAAQTGFPQPSINWELMKGVLFSDVDNDGKKEIIGNNFSGGSVDIFNADNTPHPWADVVERNFGWSMPVAYDFDHDGNKEIIMGATGVDASGNGAGIYIFKKDGTAYTGTNPVHIPVAGYRNDFPVVIADLDNDKDPEILFVEAKNNTAHIHAMKANGTMLSGWDNTTHPSFSLSTSVLTSSDANVYNGQFCTIASVGDLNKDGQLEVTAGDAGHLYIWPATGGNSALQDIAISSYATSTNIVPIIADIDNNPADLEVITSGPAQAPLTGFNVYAYKMNGTAVVGFPIYVEDVISNSACVDDIDGNGTNELIVTGTNNFYVWDSQGLNSNNEYGWPSFRRDHNNTAVFPIMNDLYIKDIATDDGREPLPGYNAWDLCDGNGVWLRNTAATQTSSNPPHYTFENQHQNAEWISSWATTPSSRPHIYAKVYNRGGNTISGTLHFYYHKFSTNDHWGTYGSTNPNAYGSWEEILCGDTNGDGYINMGETLCGDINNNGVIDGSEVSPNTITLHPGENGVVETIWNNVAQPAFQNPAITGNRNEWCILVRMESVADPIVGEVLGISAGGNAQTSNNITQKNVMFVNYVPGIVCHPFSFGNESASLTNNNLVITDKSTPAFSAAGKLKLDLGMDVYNSWARTRSGVNITDGKQKYQHTASNGQVHNHLGFQADPNPYQVVITGSSSGLNSINVPASTTYDVCPEFEFTPGAASTNPYKFNIYQKASTGGGSYAFTGAVNYYIDKPQCPSVSTSGNVSVGRFCSTTLQARSERDDASYIWRNNKTGEVVSTSATFSVSPYVTTTYEVEMTTPDHCADYGLVTVSIDSRLTACKAACGTPDITSFTLRANTTYSSETHVVNGIITVPGGKTLTIRSSSLHFSSSSGIVVQVGGKLVIDGSTLDACDAGWKGITVTGAGTDNAQLRITNSRIIDANIGVEAIQVLNPVISGSILDKGQCALKFSKCKNFTITDNQIFSSREGIYSSKHLLDAGSVISGNVFTNNDTVIILKSSNHTYLDITCNTFDTYKYYAIFSDTTILKNQGNSMNGPANLFVPASSQTNHMLHHYHGNSMTYYSDPSVAMVLTPASGMTASVITAVQDGICGGGGGLRILAQEDETILQTGKADYVNCVPNPAAYSAAFVYALTTKPASAEIRVTNMFGSTIATYQLSGESGRIEMDCTSLSSGIYFYTLIADGQVVETKKMAITK